MSFTRSVCPNVNFFLFLQEMFTYSQHRTQRTLLYTESFLSLGKCAMTETKIAQHACFFLVWYIFLTFFFPLSLLTFTAQLCLQRFSSLCLFHGRHPHGLQWTLCSQGGSQLPVGGLHREDPLPSTRHSAFQIHTDPTHESHSQWPNSFFLTKTLNRNHLNMMEPLYPKSQSYCTSHVLVYMIMSDFFFLLSLDPRSRLMFLFNFQCPGGTFTPNMKSTKDYPDEVINFMRNHPAMYNAVYPVHKRPLVVRTNVDYEFTTITVDQVTAADGNYEVLFLGTGECHELC